MIGEEIMINFTNIDFTKVEKLVASKGDNWDSDRKIEIMVNGVEVVLCLDEYNRVIMVLTVDGNCITKDNIPIAEKCLTQLIEDSRIGVYTDAEEREYLFYLEDIRPNCECPDVDDGMLVVQACDWLEIKGNLIA
jgi:hypothetical protein